MTEQLMTYLAMGGYAVYVWPAYGLVTLVMTAMVLDTLHTLRQRKAELELLEAAVGRRRRRRPTAGSSTQGSSAQGSSAQGSSTKSSSTGETEDNSRDA